MYDYYSQKLSASRLKEAYRLAPPRIRQYLKAEIDFVLNHIKPGDLVLELGCGYGRVLRELVVIPNYLIGIDISMDSLKAAHAYLPDNKETALISMDAACLGLKSNSIDLTVCIQNGISAFHIPPEMLISECIRIAKPGGRVLISSYASDIWQDRLEWFRLQSEAGLVGEIDWQKTGDGKIVCKDGFSGTTYNQNDFETAVRPFKIPYKIVMVDNSSIFCDIRIPKNR